MKYIKSKFKSKNKTNNADSAKMEPVQIKISEVLPDGIMTIHLSKKFKSY